MFKVSIKFKLPAKLNYVTEDLSNRTQCYQCGNHDNQVPCTEEEFELVTPTPCPRGLDYCMTDVAKSSSGQPMTIYKR